MSQSSEKDLMESNLSTRLIVERLIQTATVNQRRFISAEKILIEYALLPWWDFIKKSKLKKLAKQHFMEFENLEIT
jgi:hypothetical protein